MNDFVYKASIITVSFNSVKTIEQTIQSVLGQTYKNIEYIVIDGESTDGTQQVIEKYVDQISYYASEKDDGLYYAMNKGIQKATGDIVGIINSDDWYAETAVEDVVKCFCQNNAEVVYGITVFIEEDGKKQKKGPSPIELIWHQMPVGHPSVFVKKAVYNRLGGFDTNYRVSADYDFLLRCYSENVRFAYCDRVIAYFRRGGISEIYGEVRCKESYKVSMSYVDRCPYKADLLSKIEEIHDWSCFKVELDKDNGMLHRLLCEYFQTNVADILIFGTGIWGKRCCKYLTENGGNIAGFADNDVSKWNQKFCGFRIIDPDKLRSMKAYVLIAVKEHGEEIKKQLYGMGNNRLKCVTITELVELYSMVQLSS